MRICRDPRDAAARLMVLRDVLLRRRAKAKAGSAADPAAGSAAPVRGSGSAADGDDRIRPGDVAGLAVGLAWLAVWWILSGGAA